MFYSPMEPSGPAPGGSEDPRTGHARCLEALSSSWVDAADRAGRGHGCGPPGLGPHGGLRHRDQQQSPSLLHPAHDVGVGVQHCVAASLPASGRAAAAPSCQRLAAAAMVPLLLSGMHLLGDFPMLNRRGRCHSGVRCDVGASSRGRELPSVCLRCACPGGPSHARSGRLALRHPAALHLYFPSATWQAACADTLLGRDSWHMYNRQGWMAPLVPSTWPSLAASAAPASCHRGDFRVLTACKM